MPPWPSVTLEGAVKSRSWGGRIDDDEEHEGEQHEGRRGRFSLTKRLGPLRKVVKMTRASETEASYNLTLECKHVRVGTKRKSLRCGRCRK